MEGLSKATNALSLKEGKKDESRPKLPADVTFITFDEDARKGYTIDLEPADGKGMANTDYYIINVFLKDASGKRTKDVGSYKLYDLGSGANLFYFVANKGKYYLVDFFM